MTTPAINNKVIFEAMHDACTSAVEHLPKTQEYLKERYRLIALIEGKVPRRVRNEVEDLFINLAVYWGYEMFKLGIELGRNPAAIFDLSEGEE